MEKGITCDGALDAFGVAVMGHARRRHSMIHSILYISVVHTLAMAYGMPSAEAEALLFKKYFMNKSLLVGMTGSARPSPNVYSRLGGWIVDQIRRHARVVGKRSGGQAPSDQKVLISSSSASSQLANSMVWMDPKGKKHKWVT